MDSAQLLEYLSGFPRNMLYALIPFFLPMQKKRNWYWFLPLPLLLLTACVGLGMLLFPRLPQNRMLGPFFFGIHYLAVFACLSLSLCLMCASTWEESMHAVLCAYMAQHLSYCLDTLATHFWGNSPAWNGDLFHYPVMILLYVFLYFFLARPLCINGHYPSSHVHSAGLLVVEMGLMYAISIYTVQIEMPWLHAVYAMICILFIMVSERRWTEYMHAQDEMQKKEQLWALSKAQYEMTQENIEIINRKCHDLRHQVMALRSVAGEEAREEAIASMERAVQIYDSAYRTGNKTLDTVLMQKGLVCSQNQISLSVMADGKLLNFIDPVDLYTLLANILDNAIEASLHLTNPAARSIHVSVHEKKGLIILQEENPYSGDVVLRDGLPVTTKEDKTSHGFGTRSIQYTAEKYSGVMRLSTDGGMFVLRIIFPAPEAEDANQDEKMHS